MSNKLEETKEILSKIKRAAFFRIALSMSKKEFSKINQERMEKNEPKLSKEERHKIIRAKEKKIKRNATRAALIGTAVAIFGAGMKTTKLIEEAKERRATEITIDAEEKGKPINITNFRDSLKVNGYNVEQNEINANEELDKRVLETINSLNTRKEGLDYAKKIYLDAYNEKNNAAITLKYYGTDSNVRLQEKVGDGGYFTLYRDFAENGDQIIRITYGSENEIDSKDKLIEQKIITATVKDEGQINVETATEYFGEIVRVYDSDEFVQEYTDNVLTTDGMADVVKSFIEFFDEKSNQANSKKLYAFQSLKNYEQIQEEKVKNKILQENTDKGFDITD